MKFHTFPRDSQSGGAWQPNPPIGEEEDEKISLWLANNYAYWSTKGLAF